MQRPSTANRAGLGIRDYAAIGNCHGVALIGCDGRVDWCALQAFDADPVCFRLLDERVGGYLDIRPMAPFQVTRRYVPHTNVLETTFTSSSGVATLTDFMPLGRDPAAAADDFIRVQALPWLVRMIHVTRGEMSFKIGMLPGVAWGEREPRVRGIEQGMAWDGGTLLCDVPIEVHELRGSCAVTLREGERLRLVLMAGSGPAPAVVLTQLDRLLAITVAYWKAWSGRSGYQGFYTQAVERSALALKLLTYAPTGAIIAAGTTSLPETLGGGRNWDYRLSWVRDSTLTLFALSALGYHEEPEEFRQFLFDRGAGDIFPTQIVYGINGETDLTERELPHLGGYGGSRPVRIGNAAHRQRQLDVYGDVMDWLMLRQELGGSLDPSELALLRRTADYVAEHWCERGQGFWEERGEPEHFVYGKMMCWVALDRAQVLLECRDYEDAMRAIVEDVHQRGISPRGWLRKYYDHDQIDAVALRAPIIDFPLPPDCLQATIDEVMTQLATPRGIYRYNGGDGLDGKEGSFVACGFWLVDALLFAGKTQQAREWFETLLRQANDVGLYAEEIDTESGSFLGNFPQALSHLALIHAAVLLDFVEHSGGDALQGTHADRVQHAERMMEEASKARQALRPGIDAKTWVLDLAELGLA
ncbi:glycoside hydrolase family 15 protein [Dyella flagellata]|uniref:Glucoamylase n=1 Tax=Dyella flagellata TaxID=1867833 RepID=A0ABQ5X904_9GAMM|nr:glycoside hydrolase family 15 protein [Dyella flagellata]GLQ88055.1 glucoamylase [Dyella flagellata]